MGIDKIGKRLLNVSSKEALLLGTSMLAWGR